MLAKKLKNKTIKCLACAHYCIIKPRGFGICGTRQNQNGKLVSITYGNIAAIHLDPIEKKPLYHFLPGSKVLSIGTFGCNFRCPWCQNFDISQATKNKKKVEYWGEKFSPEEIVKLALAEVAPSIAYTYNEPSIFIEFAHDIAKIAKKFGLKNIFVTNGYFSHEAFNFIKPYLDAANVDLKSMDENFYQKYCGAKLRPVLETIKKLHKTKIHLEITTLLIPGLNDQEENLQRVAKFISNISAEIPWHISGFYPTYKLANFPPTTKKTLEKARMIGQEFGLKNIYLGNI
jgi:pyruvate formate lyase activating enzyme